VPFEPLPEIFLDQIALLQSKNNAGILDLGSGEGAFGRLLKASGLPVVELDCSSLASGGSLAVRGDALNPPFLEGSLDCLISGNLVRHLMVQDISGNFLNQLLNLLKPQGTFFIFEDEPDSIAADARNFKDLQAFLAEMMPHHRGPLISLEFFEEWADKLVPAQIWQSGIERNLNSPNVEAVLNMLTANGMPPNPASRAGQILESIKVNGLSYGSYWWASTKVD